MHHAHMHSSTPDTRPLDDRGDREHRLWLEMRSAYDNYREASEFLDAVALQGPIDISSRDRTWGIESLAAKQRIEFERYIDKRLQYSEFVRDRSNLASLHVNFQRTAGDSTASNQRRGRRLWLGNMTSRIAVGAALLCITFFIVRDQMRIHDLDVARLETSATLNHTRDDYHSLSRKLSASSMPNQLASREVLGAAAPSLPPQPNSGYGGSVGNRAAATAVARKYKEPIRSPKSGGRSYHWFTLTPSTKFKQVGTVGLSLRKDPKRGYFDLRLTGENSKLEKKHVKLEVPVWIDAGDRSQSAAVVLTRIQKNYVQGYLSEPIHRRPETTATDQARRMHRRS
jgi:hypothetical protein